MWLRRRTNYRALFALYLIYFIFIGVGLYLFALMGAADRAEENNYFFELVIYFLILILSLFISNNSSASFKGVFKRTANVMWYATIFFLILAGPGMLMIWLNEGNESLIEVAVYVMRIAAVISISLQVALNLVILLFKKI